MFPSHVPLNIPTFTFERELNRRRRNGNAAQEKIEGSERKSYDRSYPIPEIAGKWESAVMTFAIALGSIDRENRPAIFGNAGEKAGQKPSPRMASIKRASPWLYSIFPSNVDSSHISFSQERFRSDHERKSARIFSNMIRERS